MSPDQQLQLYGISSTLHETLQAIHTRYGRELNNGSHFNFCRGIGSRFNSVTDSVIELIFTINEDPGSHKIHRKNNMYLNMFYINLVGILDNIAWVSYYEKLFPKEIKRTQVSATSSVFLEDLLAAGFDLASIMRPNLDWARDLKSFRDPVAHRVPLDIPYRIIDEDETRAEKKRIDKECETPTPRKTGADIVGSLRRAI